MTHDFYGMAQKTKVSSGKLQLSVASLIRKTDWKFGL